VEGCNLAEPFADQVIQRINEVDGLYYRLALLVAPAGAGKTRALQAVADRLGISLINVNLELSGRMLELTERQRVLQLPRLLSEVVDKSTSDAILLDNIEILFDVSLKQDPLRLLQALSRNKTVVASWNGSVANGQLIYGSPDHAEYKRYPVRDFLIMGPEVAE
jgi:hypothetical protein